MKDRCASHSLATGGGCTGYKGVDGACSAPRNGQLRRLPSIESRQYPARVVLRKMRPELQKAIQLLRTDPAGVPHALRLLQGTVFSFSMKLCGHREDAEDTMQDVLVSSLPHLAKIEDPRALSVWLYTAARNRCWRKRKKESTYKTVALEDLMPDGAELSALLTAAAASPEAKALTHEDQRRVHQAVLQLSPQYRLVLVLHDMEELDTEQVAAVLSLQPGTVRVRLHRARLLLRKELEKLHRGPADFLTPQKTIRRKTPTGMHGNLRESLRIPGWADGEEELQTDAGAY